MLRPQTYGRLIKEEIDCIWGDMLFWSTTSCFGRQNWALTIYVKLGSLCHGWSAVPLYFYYRYVLGEKLDSSMEKPVVCGIGIGIHITASRCPTFIIRVW